MTKLWVPLLFFCFISCVKKENHINSETDVFLRSFIELNKKKYDFNKVKYISSGDSLEYIHWIKDSGIDTIYLKKKIDAKNLFELRTIKSIENRYIFRKYKKFDFTKFYNYKLENPKSNFNEYYSNYFKRCELLSIQFIVFNKAKDKVLISHSLDCTFGSIEIYGKTKKNNWFLLNNIARISN